MWCARSTPPTSPRAIWQPSIATAGCRTPGERPIVIRDPVTSNPLFTAVIVADAKGEVVATTLPGIPAMNISVWDNVRALAERPSDRLLIGRPLISPRLNRPMVALTRRIDRPDGSFGGTVTLQVDVARFIAFTEGATDRNSDVISVIRRDGITIARRTGGRFSFGENLTGTLVMRQQQRRPSSTLPRAELARRHRALVQPPPARRLSAVRDQRCGPRSRSSRRLKRAPSAIAPAAGC